MTSVKENGTLKLRYTYDNLGQLTREDNAYAGKTYVYTYDNGGNVLTKKTYAYTTGMVGTVQSTVNYGYGNSNWKDQLTSYNGTAITYDLSGNPLKWRNASSMTWTGRQLDSMTLTDGTSVSFQYNSDGLRVSKTVGNNTVKYRWDGTTLLAEEHTNYTLTFLYDGGALIGFNYGGNNYYYGIDNLGVIHYVYNEAGTVVVTYTYDAWGNTISASGNSSLININPIRYKSYYYDSETGLFYLQSRYYDAVVGRFISADDISYMNMSGTLLSCNLYAYCENNPINYSDPSGYITPANVIGAIIAGIIGAVGGYFLSRWFADKLGLSGWKRSLFIGGLTSVITASAAAIGYFIGPYVAKAWSVWSAKLAGLIKGTFKSIAKITSHKMKHINVSKHLWNKVMKKVTTTQIETLIHQGIRKGTWNLLSNGSVRILYNYGGQIIVITGKVVNSIFQISNAWVWNGIGTP